LQNNTIDPSGNDTDFCRPSVFGDVGGGWLMDPYSERIQKLALQRHGDPAELGILNKY
jgi:hypothetical protein